MLNLIKRLKKRKYTGSTYIDKVQIRIEGIYSAHIEDYKKACTIFGENVKIVDKFKKGKSRHYVYHPCEALIDSNQMREVAFALLGRELDYVVVSNTLDDFPTIGAGHLEDAVVYNEESCDDISTIFSGEKPLCGRLLRLPGYNKSDNIVQLPSVEAKIELVQENYLCSNGKCIPKYHEVKLNYSFDKQKKRIFVFPIFMAVGGVERNTVEIMRALQNDYEFCVITIERHMKAQGSLNHQLKGLCLANYDLRELVDFEDYFAALRCLKDIYQPDVVWLCNNSPWLEANMLSFRELFREQRIVAQDVYDTKAGWIEYYHTKGMHSVDRYIAVNEKIKKVFIDEYKIEEEKIRVIYSAIDEKRIKNTMHTIRSREELCLKYGIDADKKHIALIGRMTEQKNPLRYLGMIAQVRSKYPEIEFLLVGDGVLSGQVDEYIRENQLAESVKRIKFVESTPELFQVLDGLVLTSLYEGLAIVSIEAMCLGVPVLSTDTGDLKLFLDDTKGGVIINEEKSDADNFRLWYDELVYYTQNSKKHAARILNFFSAEFIAKQYCQIFEQ